MIRPNRVGSVLTALVVCVAGLGVAQERGEEVVGTITQVDGSRLTVRRENAPDVQVRVNPNAEVTFRDSGDRKLFPNPTAADLRAGMGVRFVYGTGVLDKITVHYVPAGQVAAPPANIDPAMPGGNVGARLQSVGSREIRADVAGRSRTFPLASSGVARGFRSGDLVVLTLDDRGTVVEIASSTRTGIVTRVVTRTRSISIDADGREETYSVDNTDLLRDVREGDRVNFEVEERSSGGRVVTSLRRAR